MFHTTFCISPYTTLSLVCDMGWYDMEGKGAEVASPDGNYNHTLTQWSNQQNKGLISTDRSNKATLQRTTPRSKFKSSARDSASFNMSRNCNAGRVGSRRVRRHPTSAPCYGTRLLRESLVLRVLDTPSCKEASRSRGAIPSLN